MGQRQSDISVKYPLTSFKYLYNIILLLTRELLVNPSTTTATTTKQQLSEQPSAATTKQQLSEQPVITSNDIKTTPSVNKHPKDNQVKY